MSTRDEELERLVREAAASAPVPEFERVWRRAKARAGKGGSRGGAWQWALGPLLAAVSVVVPPISTTTAFLQEVRYLAPATLAQGTRK